MSFIVIYDDEQGLTTPMGWDDDCEGAICAFGDHVATFPTRQAARHAITISRRFAQLNEAQGKPVNTDFTVGYSSLKIIPLKGAKQ